MRRLVAGGALVLFGALGAVSTVGGCGDSGSGGDGGTAATGQTTGVGTGTTSTGTSGCTEINITNFIRYYYDDAEGFTNYIWYPDVQLGAAMADNGNLEFLDLAKTGVVTLGAGDEANYGTCKTCFILFEDNDPDPNSPTSASKVYFATEGTLDLGISNGTGPTGTLSNVKLVEVTVDPMTKTSTVVPGGACFHLANAQFSFQPPPASWTCEPVYFDDKTACDCECGGDDPDCANASFEVFGCDNGGACVMGHCGAPTAWTCDVAKYNGGAGNGCDCNCGAFDPDCLLTGEATVGCTAMAPTCNAEGLCVPNAWDCNVDYFGDGYCDCGCGVLDPSCANANKSSCEVCDDPGSCDNVSCSDANSTINATNNAICN